MGKLKEYSTNVQILQRDGDTVKVECSIKQGFKHQVRCHLAWIGLPIINDCVYNKESLNENKEICFSATKLKFVHPITKEIIEYIASYGGSYATKKGKSVHEAEFFSHQIKLKQAERFVIQKKGEESAKSAEISHAEANAMPFFNQIAKKKEPVVIVPEKECGKVQVIALGISTGGPNALRELFKNIDPNVKQPILVVQHMPAGFTKEFAASLNNLCPLTVTEARDGEPLMPGHVYIAPGNYHIYVEHRPLGNLVRLSQEPQRNGHRPSADVLFESVAKIYQNNALGIIMTGMGRDGAAGIP